MSAFFTDIGTIVAAHPVIIGAGLLPLAIVVSAFVIAARRV